MLEWMLNALGLRRKASAQSVRPADTEEDAREESLSSVNDSQRKEEEEKKSYMTYPCPFCGQAVLTFVRQTLATGGRHDGEHLTLCCEYCGARGPLAETHEECAEKWNRPSLKYNGIMQQMEKIEQERDSLKEKLEQQKDSGLDSLIKECLKEDCNSPFGWKTIKWTSSSYSEPKKPRSSRIGSGCRRTRHV